jgi:hypothetical protein
VSATLAKAINAQAVNVRVSGSAGHSIPFYARLEDEIVRVTSFYEAGGTARLVRGAFGTARVPHAASTEIVALDWADGIVEFGTRVALFGEGAPTDGVDGTGALVAAAGSTYTDITAGTVYVNNGTPTSPAWQSGGPGGGVTVTGSQSGEVAAASSVQLLGAVSEGSPGIATQGGLVVQSVLQRTTDQGDLSLPGGDQFTTIVMDPVYDPAGYYSANLPEAGVPGFLVPVGKGGLHRVALAARIGGLGGWIPGNYRLFSAIQISQVTEDIPGDLRDTKLIDGADDAGAGDSFYCNVVYLGQMDDGEEMAFYAKSDTGTTSTINPGSCAVIEKLI